MVAPRSLFSVGGGVALLVLLASGPNAVDAHQKVTIPAPTFTADKDTSYNPIAFLENQGYPAAADHVPYFKSKGIKTLRHFMDNKANYKVDQAGATFECGYTNPNGARQPVPANGMMRSTGYTHDGPCEVWIDNTRVLGSSTGNCNKDVGSKFISYKVDFSVCKGDCMLRWYWLGKRLIGKKWSWQVYKECIPIKGGAARSAEDVGADVGVGYNETMDATSGMYKENDGAEEDNKEMDENEKEEKEEKKGEEEDETIPSYDDSTSAERKKGTRCGVKK